MPTNYTNLNWNLIVSIVKHWLLVFVYNITYRRTRLASLGQAYNFRKLDFSIWVEEEGQD